MQVFEKIKAVFLTNWWLQVRQQTLYVLQVLPSGRFVKVQSIGAVCNDDDQLFLDMHEESERQWQIQQTQVSFNELNCSS